MRYSSVLKLVSKKSLEIELLEDTVKDYIGQEVREEDIWEGLLKKINHYVDNIEGQVIVPTSGGFDSRIINFLIRDKSKIRAFTYGISENQEESFEVQYAKKLCEILNIKWKQIYLGDFNKYIEENIEITGISSTPVGMYHLEFYRYIERKLGKLNKRMGWISGIVGDAWAGSIKPIKKIDINNFNLLGYTHGVHADSKYCLLKSEPILIDDFLKENKDSLHDPVYQIVHIIRFKIILLSYLIKFPVHFGIRNILSPYLDIDIAIKMLNLSQEKRENRKWQVDYFRKNNILIGEMSLKCSKNNCLDKSSLDRFIPKPLNISILSELFEKKYLERINDTYTNKKFLNSYFAYLALCPIQKLLESRK